MASYTYVTSADEDAALHAFVQPQEPSDIEAFWQRHVANSLSGIVYSFKAAQREILIASASEAISAGKTFTVRIDPVTQQPVGEVGA